MDNLAQNVFTELDNINTSTVSDKFGNITVLNFDQFLAELHRRQPQEIKTDKLIEFVNTLGKNKSGGKNAISRLQYFINAYIQEITVREANKGVIEFIGDDHYSLTRGSTGTNKADFYLYGTDGNTYTIDAKIFDSEMSYLNYLSTTNFHDADYALVYLRKAKTWRFSRKADNYQNLASAIVFLGSDPWLSELKLPRPLRLISFFTENLNKVAFRELCDKDVPKKVNYEFSN
jgi:hypothetical protein